MKKLFYIIIFCTALVVFLKAGSHVFNTENSKWVILLILSLVALYKSKMKLSNI